MGRRLRSGELTAGLALEPGPQAKKSPVEVHKAFRDKLGGADGT